VRITYSGSDSGGSLYFENLVLGDDKTPLLVGKYILQKLPAAFEDALVFPTFVCMNSKRSIKVLAVFANQVAKDEMAARGAGAPADQGSLVADGDDDADAEVASVEEFKIEVSKPALPQRGPELTIKAAVGMWLALAGERSMEAGAAAELDAQLDGLAVMGGHGRADDLPLVVQALRSRPLLESPLLSGGYQWTTARMREAAAH